MLRQFETYQRLPAEPVELGKYHDEDLRGNTKKFWPREHYQWICLWDNQLWWVADGVSILNMDFSMFKQYQMWLLENGKTFLYVDIDGFIFVFDRDRALSGLHLVDTQPVQPTLIMDQFQCMHLHRPLLLNLQIIQKLHFEWKITRWTQCALLIRSKLKRGF